MGTGLLCNGQLSGVAFRIAYEKTKNNDYFFYSTYLDVHRYKDWIEAQKSGSFMPEPKIFIVLTVPLITYALHALV